MEKLRLRELLRIQGAKSRCDLLNTHVSVSAVSTHKLTEDYKLIKIPP